MVSLSLSLSLSLHSCLILTDILTLGSGRGITRSTMVCLYIYFELLVTMDYWLPKNHTNWMMLAFMWGACKTRVELVFEWRWIDDKSLWQWKVLTIATLRLWVWLSDILPTKKGIELMPAIVVIYGPSTVNSRTFVSSLPLYMWMVLGWPHKATVSYLGKVSFSTHVKSYTHSFSLIKVLHYHFLKMVKQLFHILFNSSC